MDRIKSKGPGLFLALNPNVCSLLTASSQRLMRAATLAMLRTKLKKGSRGIIPKRSIRPCFLNLKRARTAV